MAVTNPLSLSWLVSVCVCVCVRERERDTDRQILVVGGVIGWSIYSRSCGWQGIKIHLLNNTPGTGLHNNKIIIMIFF